MPIPRIPKHIPLIPMPISGILIHNPCIPSQFQVYQFLYQVYQSLYQVYQPLDQVCQPYTRYTTSTGTKQASNIPPKRLGRNNNQKFHFFQRGFPTGFRFDPEQGVHADPATGQQQGQVGAGPRRATQTRRHKPGLFDAVSIAIVISFQSFGLIFTDVRQIFCCINY